MSGRQRALVRAGVLVGLLAASIAGCGQGDGGSQRAAAFVLRSDNTLLAVSAGGAPITSIRLGRGPLDTGPGNRLVLGGNGTSLYVLIGGLPDGGDRVDLIDVRRMRVERPIGLPEGVTFTVLAAGSRSGRLYVAGRTQAGGAVVTAGEPGAGDLPRSASIRDADGHDWLPYGLAVSPDESTLVVSYHGRDTSGADRVSVRGLRRAECKGRARPGLGCLGRVHGSVALDGGDVHATTGSRTVVRYGRDGQVLDTVNSRLAGNHLMILEFDPVAGELFLLGSCGYAGGLTKIDLATTRIRRLARPRAPGGSPQLPSASRSMICGDALSVGEDAIYVARGRELLVLDRRSGRLLRSVDMQAPILDVVADPARG
jgi:hypothetical protein